MPYGKKSSYGRNGNNAGTNPARGPETYRCKNKTASRFLPQPVLLGCLIFPGSSLKRQKNIRKITRTALPFLQSIPPLNNQTAPLPEQTGNGAGSLKVQWKNRYSVMPAASASAALASRRAARTDIFTRPLSSMPMHLAVTTSPTLTTSSVLAVRPSASSEM